MARSFKKFASRTLALVEMETSQKQMKPILIGLVVAMFGVASFVAGWAANEHSVAAIKPSKYDKLFAAAAPPAPHHLEIREVGLRIFVFDTVTGETWRYFMEKDEKGKLTSEGFVPLRFINLNDAVEWWKHDPAVASPTPEAFDPDAYLANRASPTPTRSAKDFLDSP